MKRHTLHDAMAVLDSGGFRFKQSGHYILAQCPKHNGEDLNCQISLTRDDRLYAYCHSHCEGYFLDEVFDELRNEEFNGRISQNLAPRSDFMNKVDKQPISKPKTYQTADLWPLWKSLGGLPKEPIFIGIDNSELEELGWRWIENGPHGLGTGVFIPYWNKLNEGPLLFAQVRHLTGKCRFNFAKDYKPIVFGKWVIHDILEDEERMPLCIVEGSHDAIVLNHCNIPAIAMPSSSSTELLSEVAKFLHQHNVPIIYAGDNDEAGQKLQHTLDQCAVPYKVKTPAPYKDWGVLYEMLGFSGIDKVFNPPSRITKKTYQGVFDVFGDCQVLASSI